MEVGQECKPCLRGHKSRFITDRRVCNMHDNRERVYQQEKGEVDVSDLSALAVLEADMRLPTLAARQEAARLNPEVRRLATTSLACQII